MRRSLRFRPQPIVVLLGLLALWDLRIELQLLLQQFTWSGLRAAVLAHPLAVVVLALLPTMQRNAGAARAPRPSGP